ncbi:MAG: Arc family DNA-binding protein [Hyphomicrobiaceae bacterium]
MARPRKGQEKGATATIGLRVPEELRERLVRLAEANARSITDEATIALEQYVKREERKANR